MLFGGSMVSVPRPHSYSIALLLLILLTTRDTFKRRVELETDDRLHLGNMQLQCTYATYISNILYVRRRNLLNGFVSRYPNL